jgi:hypothetical protein
MGRQESDEAKKKDKEPQNEQEGICFPPEIL